MFLFKVLNITIILGWWKYDLRTKEEIEVAFNNNIQDIELLICGELYIIDLVNYIQYPKRNSSKKRRIRRGTESLVVKGIAGVPLS